MLCKHYEISNSIHRHNEAIEADDDSRSRKRTALYINHTRLAEKNKLLRDLLQILCTDFSCGPSEERMKARVLELVLILAERAKENLQGEKQVAAEVPSMEEQASRSSKKQKSYKKKLNCSMIAREFNKVLEE